MKTKTHNRVEKGVALLSKEERFAEEHDRNGEGDVTKCKNNG